MTLPNLKDRPPNMLAVQMCDRIGGRVETITLSIDVAGGGPGETPPGFSAAVHAVVRRAVLSALEDMPGRRHVLMHASEAAGPTVAELTHALCEVLDAFDDLLEREPDADPEEPPAAGLALLVACAAADWLTGRTPSPT